MYTKCNIVLYIIWHCNLLLFCNPNLVFIGQSLQGVIPPPSARESKHMLPYVLIWDPVTAWKIESTECAHCLLLTKMIPERWTDSSTSSLLPWHLYGIESIVYLIMCVCKCSNCKCTMLSHDSRLSFPEEAPFVLFYKSGITKHLGNIIFSLVTKGLGFQQIESFLAEQYWLTHTMQQQQFQSNYALSQRQWHSNFSLMNADFISNDLLYKIYMQMFLCEEMKYSYNMECILAEKWVAFDHTFKIANNIGYFREGTWTSQYNSCFFVLNEKGQVLGWQFTVGTLFDEVTTLLKGIYFRHNRAGKNITHFCVDNCCQSKATIKRIFGAEVRISSDLFHAIQRVSKCLPKRNELYPIFSLELSQAFRSQGDHGTMRKLDTPIPTIIRSNLEKWVKKWLSIGGEALINKDVVSAIVNLRVHIDNGCLSGIPPGCGTNRNENLHRQLNTHFHQGKVVILLAYAFISTQLYIHNNKIYFKGKHVVPPVSYISALSSEESQGREQSNCLPEIFGIIPKTTEMFSTIYDQCKDKQKLPPNLPINVNAEKLLGIVKRAILHASSFSEFHGMASDSKKLQSAWEDALSFALKESLTRCPKFESHLTTLGYQLDTSQKVTVTFLRRLLVNEWLGERKEEYLNLITHQNSYEGDVEKFLQSGFYDNDIGDIMAPAAANPLSATICVITSFSHGPVMVFSPTTYVTLPDPINLYLAYNGSGAGHYDGVKMSTKMTLNNKCKCGINKTNDASHNSCTNENKTSKYKSRCPCLRTGVGCGGNCRCINCNNPNGRKLEVAPPPLTCKRTVPHKMTLPTSKRFALDRRETLSTGKWSILETFLLKDIIIAFKLSDPEEVMLLLNLAIMEADKFLKNQNIEDYLCAKSIRSVASKMRFDHGLRKKRFND